MNLDTDSFTENGGAAALTSADQSTNATFTTLGVRVQTPVALGEMQATLSGRLGWRHVIGDTPTSKQRLAGGNALCARPYGQRIGTPKCTILTGDSH